MQLQKQIWHIHHRPPSDWKYYFLSLRTLNYRPRLVQFAIHHDTYVCQSSKLDSCHDFHFIQISNKLHHS